ncbi:hypothetical protein A2165_02870 [Candidatus Curtissbacteria bacterium RBG_13_40_7]|uniref:Four helix bundle protein n=1 Tax=Candidatus Curtissbacteria bacterium RBG_13_40_7 TaxID=1797706 RepID=A0A1F5FX21_9BACT|nr:MAG: hypothetical protein A2165_02870 [Candidatus Curtissbacteria bacterium RBG_13_40_7]
MSDERFRFEKLTVYQRSLELTNNIYKLTKEWPREYLFDLTSQIRRATLSIPLNIAEGSGRGKNEFKRFLEISRSSCFEIIPLVEIAVKQNLVTVNVKDEIIDEVYQISKMISKLKSSMK